MNWFQPALDLLQRLPSESDARLHRFFSPERPVSIAPL